VGTGDRLLVKDHRRRTIEIWRIKKNTAQSVTKKPFKAHQQACTAASTAIPVPPLSMETQGSIAAGRHCTRDTGEVETETAGYPQPVSRLA